MGFHLINITRQKGEHEKYAHPFLGDKMFDERLLTK